MKKHSKRYQDNAKLLDPAKSYTVDEAVALLYKFKGGKETATVDLALYLGIDPKRADQLVRGSYSLPKGIGKTLKVVVFAEGPKAQEAKDAGADEVGSADLAKKIQEGWTEFDVVIASPDQMKNVGKLGKVLGPQGKMPSPKNGTITQDIGRTVSEYKAGKIEFRNDKEGNVHVLVGKRSFAPEDLTANIKAFIVHIQSVKPQSAKGTFIRSATLSTTQSPGIPMTV